MHLARTDDIVGTDKEGNKDVPAYGIQKSYDLAHGDFKPNKGGTEQARFNADNWAWLVTGKMTFKTMTFAASSLPLS